jgi:hypothetical protein
MHEGIYLPKRYQINISREREQFYAFLVTEVSKNKSKKLV